MNEQQAAQMGLDVTRRLGRAMLMVDLLTHRLADVYAQRKDAESRDELLYAIEHESEDLLALLGEAQSLVLDAAATAKD